MSLVIQKQQPICIQLSKRNSNDSICHTKFKYLIQETYLNKLFIEQLLQCLIKMLNLKRYGMITNLKTLKLDT